MLDALGRFPLGWTSIGFGIYFPEGYWVGPNYVDHFPLYEIEWQFCQRLIYVTSTKVYAKVNLREFPRQI